jgi:hypothetical protein
MCLTIEAFVELDAIQGVGFAGQTGILMELATTLDFETR